MRHLIKTFLFTVILLSSARLSMAQNGPGNFSITGTVTDTLTSRPIPYLSISLKNEKGIAVKAMPADADGYFKLTGIKNGRYYLVSSALDYLPKTLPVEFTDSSKAVLHLLIALQPAPKNLKEVQIVGNRPLIKQEIDRITYDIQADPESKATNVLGMMRKVPFLTVDGSDNLLLKGKEDYKILINGRPSSMLERDYKTILRSMAASSIERIEVITNPPSKYDGEGIGGIINIITVKNITNGYNGTASLNGRFPTGGPTANGSLNFKQDRFGLSASAGAGWNNVPQTSNAKTLAGTGAASRLIQTGLSDGSGKNAYTGTDLSYEIDSLNLISAAFNINTGVNDGYNGQTSRLSNPSSVLQGYNLANTSHTDGKGWDASLNYQLGFKRNKNELLTFSYRTYNYNNLLNSRQVISDRINYLIPDYRQKNDAHVGEQTVQLDYVRPLKKWSIEAGLKAILRDNDGDFVYSAFDAATNGFMADPALSNLYMNDQKIYCAYNAYQFKIKDWGFKAGVRLEQTVIAASFITTASEVNQRYTSLLPSLAISKKLNNFNSLTFGFNQRIKRASINKLNPFVDRSNPNFESSGNPGLRPSRMNQLSVGYNGFKKFSANISVDYQFATGLFIPIATYNAATQVTRTTFENVGNANGITLNMNFSYPITKAWNISGNGNTEFISLLAPTNGVVSRTTVVMYRVFGSSMYKFEKDWRVYGNINYVSRGVTTLQGRGTAYLGTSLGFSKALAKDKLTLSGSVNNPFTKFRENIIETTSPEFYQTNISREYFRTYNVTLNYSFGKLKEAIKKNKRGIRNDDMSN